MRSLFPCLAVSLLLAACATPSTSDEETGEESSTDDPGDGDGDGPATDTDTAPSENGDGDGDAELPAPPQLPTPSGNCPSFTTGNVQLTPDGQPTRTVKLWAPAEPKPGGLLLIYWHAYGSAPDEAAYTLSQPVIDAILAEGGVVAAPYSSDESGEFPWFVVNGSDRDDDMLVADEIVACAMEELGVDPRRLHSSGMSAGGLQTSAFAMARSSYLASVASFSGGVYTPLPFEDPDNPFAAMIIHGGDNDIFGGTVNFKMLSTIWFNQLVDNGNFAFMCDHGGGHTIPANYGADVANFFFAHPYGTTPSPYAAGLPAGIPSDCSL